MVKIGPEKLDLEEIDRLTPFYKHKIESELAPKERKVLASICHMVQGGNITANEVSTAARIFCLKETQTVIDSLIMKGFLSVVETSLFTIPDKKMVAHLMVRTCGYAVR